MNRWAECDAVVPALMHGMPLTKGEVLDDKSDADRRRSNRKLR
jgi:hypothetical protein